MIEACCSLVNSKLFRSHLQSQVQTPVVKRKLSPGFLSAGPVSFHIKINLSHCVAASSQIPPLHVEFGLSGDLPPISAASIDQNVSIHKSSKWNSWRVEISGPVSLDSVILSACGSAHHIVVTQPPNCGERNSTKTWAPKTTGDGTRTDSAGGFQLIFRAWFPSWRRWRHLIRSRWVSFHQGRSDCWKKWGGFLEFHQTFLRCSVRTKYMLPSLMTDGAAGCRSKYFYSEALHYGGL